MEWFFNWLEKNIFDPLDNLLEKIDTAKMRFTNWLFYKIIKPTFNFCVKADKWLTLNAPFLNFGINNSLVYATLCGYTDIIDKLLEKGANITKVSLLYNYNAVEAACKAEESEILAKLLPKISKEQRQQLGNSERLMGIIKESGDEKIYNLLKSHVTFPKDFVFEYKRKHSEYVKYRDEIQLVHIGARHPYLQENKALESDYYINAMNNMSQLIKKIKTQEDIVNGETKGRKTLKTILPVIAKALENGAKFPNSLSILKQMYENECKSLNNTNNKYCIIATGTKGHASYLVVKKLEDSGYYQVQFCDRGPLGLRENWRTQLTIPTLKLNQNQLNDVISKAIDNKDIEHNKVKETFYQNKTIFGYPFEKVEIDTKIYKRGTCSVSNLKTAVRLIIHNEIEDKGKQDEAKHIYKLFSLKLRIATIDKYDSSTRSGEKGQRKEEIVDYERKRTKLKEDKWTKEEKRRDNTPKSRFKY